MALLRRMSTAGALAAACIAISATVQTALAGIPIPGDVPTLAPIVEKVIPAVVNIAVSGSVVVQNPLLTDPFFRQFFHIPEGQMRQQSQAAGSGVIVDSKGGYILTNNHVVSVGDNQAIEVTLKDGRHFRAKLIGRDAETDLAVLKVNADKLTELPFGDSDRLRVGDYVLAIGNPFRLGQTVTSGIVSALGRSGLGIEHYENFIQTDASINPGNSGGALIDLHGQLIGINTAILGPSGASAGIGFAVPANLAKSVMAELIKDGQITRGQITGARWQDLTPDVAASLGAAKQEDGAVVTEVAPGSPAGKAGLMPGDIVIATDGFPVHTVGDIRNRLVLAHVGDTLLLSILRGGSSETVKIGVEPSPIQAPAAGLER